MHAVSLTGRIGAASLAGAILAAAVVVGFAAPVFADDPFGGAALFGKAGKKPPEISVTATLTAEELKPGAEAVLAVTVRLPKSHYIRSMTDPSIAKTKIELTEVVGLTAVKAPFVPDRKPKSETDAGESKPTEKFYDQVTWFKRFQINADADPASVEILGELTGQYCGDGMCVSIRPAKAFQASLVQGAVPIVQMPQTLVTAGVSAGVAGSEAVDNKAAAEVLPYSTTERPKSIGKPGPAELTFSLSPDDAKPGDTVTLSIRMKLDDEWHTYSSGMDEGQAAIPTAWALKAYGLTAKTAEFKVRPAPEKKTLEVGKDTYRQEVHHGEVTWSREFVVDAGDGPGGYGLAGKMEYQTCTGRNCLPPARVAFALGAVPEGAKKEAAELKVVRKERADLSVIADPPVAPGPDQGLFAFLFAAIAAGFAALLTPCVFPMVPITVSFFLKQSEAKHHRPLPMAMLYCLGIMGTFTILGLVMAAIFGATAANQLANNPWLNVAIAGVMVFFGFNLLGMFEIRVPYWLLTWTAGHEGKGGIVGVLFMALTFTLVSFTCTFAFCGLLLAWAAKGQYYWPILGMLAFSAAFSSPFFFLALFPSYLQKLPKSGGWMNTVKVTMGMIELGAAFKFFSVADLAWHPEAALFDFSFTLLAWMVISVSTGLYLLGVFRLPHDTPSESISVVRFAAALGFMLFGGVIGAGLFAQKEPGNKLWAYVKSFAPARINSGSDELGPYVDHGGLKYALDYERAFKLAREQKKPLFFDFTGVNCVNCRLMEQKMAEPRNHERLEKFVRAQLYTDNVPGITDQAEVARLLQINRKYQGETFGDATLPSYAIITPEGSMLAKFAGLEEQEGDFTQFLDEGLKRWSVVSNPKEQKLEMSGMDVLLNREQAFAKARNARKPVLVEVAAVNDVNCAEMDRIMFRGENRQRLARFVPVQLYVDNVPYVSDPVELERQLDANRKFQETTLGDSATPSYAIMTPDGKTLARLSGYADAKTVEQFLDEGLELWSASVAQERDVTAAVTTASEPRSRR